MKPADLDRLADALGGLCILGTLPGSPAELAGLRYGDVVVEVNGVPTPNWVAYLRAVESPKKAMLVRFFRDGTEHRVNLELPRERTSLDSQTLLSIVSRRVLSRDDAEELATPEEKPN